MALPITRPEPDEYDSHYAGYMKRVSGDDAVPSLDGRYHTMLQLVGGLTEPQALHRYGPDRWTIKESLGHVIDVERVMAYRALRFGRGDEHPLAPFDDVKYVAASRANDRPVAELCAELRAVREATLALLGSLDSEAMLRRGTIHGRPMSTRALLWTIAGHEIHHQEIFRERYGLELPAAARDSQ
jgi:hypothetical protein